MQKSIIIELKQPQFNIETDGSITYDIKSNRSKSVEFITDSSYALAMRSDCTLYLYKNPNTEDGLWPCFPARSGISFGSEFSDSTNNHYGMLHRGCIIFN